MQNDSKCPIAGNVQRLLLELKTQASAKFYVYGGRLQCAPALLVCNSMAIDAVLYDCMAIDAALYASTHF